VECPDVKVCLQAQSGVSICQIVKKPAFTALSGRA
jgi:hypothetical protein